MVEDDITDDVKHYVFDYYNRLTLRNFMNTQSLLKNLNKQHITITVNAIN